MKQLTQLLTTLLLLTATNAFAQKYVGGDISLLTKYETNGAKYYDHDGNAIAEVLPFLKGQGMNAMRVRLFVDPNNATTAEKGQGVCQDLDYVIALGKRIKDAGFKLMLDFHYSDTWADPAKQWTPADWLSLTDAQLQTKIYDYTKAALQKMVAAGATPDFIQTGNEISYGMLYGKGIIKSNTATETTYEVNSSTYKKCYTNSTANWDRFGNLLKQAGKACREVCPQAKIIIHTERVEQASVLTSFYDKMATLGVDYDIIGLSYYSYYHGNFSKLETALKLLETRFDKDIMLVEVGYYHHWQPSSITGDYDLSATYPITDAGQKAFTEDLIALLNQHSRVTGLFWWFMEANECGLDWNTKRVTDGWYNAGLFDNSTGRATSALSSLRKFLGDLDGIHSVQAAWQTEGDNWYTLNGQRISRPMQKDIYIHNKKKIVVK